MPSLKYFLSLGEDVLLPIGGSKKKVFSKKCTTKEEFFDLTRG